MRNLINRFKSAYWSFVNETDCCDCKPGLENQLAASEMMVDQLDLEIKFLTEELERVMVENVNLKRELEFLETE